MRGPGIVACEPMYAERGVAVVRRFLGRELVGHLVDYLELAQGQGRLDGDRAFEAVLRSCRRDLAVVTGVDLVPGTTAVERSTRGSAGLAPALDGALGPHVAVASLGTSAPTPWLLHLHEEGGEPVAVDLEPGDIVLFRADRWRPRREPLGVDWYVELALGYRGP